MREQDKKSVLGILQNSLNRIESMMEMDSSITICRNIGKKPMGDTQWDRFKADVMELVDGHTELHFIGHGFGKYKTKLEECFIVTFTTGSEYLKTIENALPIIANRYGQESVALTIGKTELFGGKNNET